ncbi:MAG: hypothetical protein KGJ23_15770 [Euryarchaeota archaeon]|nr:hypothetical protein [Euryarchaeota archaeon]MDE2046576.1 hypothetical protein [Thermoplasmata archaeon]
MGSEAGSDAPPGESRMWEFASSFPRQLKEGLRSVPRHNFAARPGVPIATVGMGGSGIAGELLSSLAARGGESALLPVRDFVLPAWVRPPVPVVFVSYSGNTAETLGAYEQARARGLPRAVIASGGRLIELAKEDGVLHVQVPPGQPPRASLGYLFGALAGILREVLPEVDRDLPRVADGLSARSEEFSSDSGLAGKLATAWGGDRDLWVYATDPLLPVARRWKTQAEENAKRLGHFDAVPELLHNAVVAWDAMPKAEAQGRFVAILHAAGEGEATVRRVDYLARSLGAQGAKVELVVPRSRGALGEMLELVWLGDYVSLWAARRRRVDPLPVPAIDKMKVALGGSAPRASGGRKG